MTENFALWLRRPGGKLVVGGARYTSPVTGEVVIKTAALAVNTIDAMPGLARRLLLPWLTYPVVLGSDVAGIVTEVGPGESRLRVGDRVIGHASGLDQGDSRAARGAFQHYVICQAHMVAPIPDDLPFEKAVVLPLAVSTAGTGLFQNDHLGLALPQSLPPRRGETVLVWGGSTSVGANAIQLASNAGYRVVATSSPHNFEFVKSLGADAVVDYHDRDAVAKLLTAIGSSPLSGILAIGFGSLKPAIRIAGGVPGGGRVAAAQPGLLVQLRKRMARRSGVTLTAVWGGSLKNNEVGPGIYVDFLPGALRDGSYRAEPQPIVVGSGLEAVPGALERLRKGVSAAKVVVTI